ncbi:hypothetical protein HN954_01020 [bacterium]|jgi:hypothetical protein|nr:hypothetical protein [bacterium]MBT6831785.1 hypothetical protein [bacterium]MBT6995992.1 hypothetical protein [bacterium]MBT7772637.1 hypothetical protein [bacterium]
MPENPKSSPANLSSEPIIPTKNGNVSPARENQNPGATPAVLSVSENTTIPTPPTKPQPVENSNTGAQKILGIKLSAEQRDALRKKRAQSQKIQNILRKVSVVFLVIAIGSFYWLKLNLNEIKNPLATFGISKNLGMKYRETERSVRILIAAVTKQNQEKDSIKQKLENEEYTVFSPEINVLRDTQLTWFDKTDETGNLEFGMMEAVPRMAEFFNDRAYSDENGIISGRAGQIEVSDIVVDRNGVRFNVSGKELLGNVFYLNLEFVKMVNSFPFLKNGKLNSFSKQEDATDGAKMQYAVKLDYQTADEVDPQDELFSKYLTWLSAKKSAETEKNPPKRTLSIPN